MDLTTYLKNHAINKLLRNQAFTPPTTLYLALFTDATTDAGGGTEVVGGSYARQVLTLAAASSGISASTNAQTYTNMPAVTVVNGAIMDALTVGNMLMHGVWSAPMILTLGQTLVIATGDVSVNWQ